MSRVDSINRAAQIRVEAASRVDVAGRCASRVPEHPGADHDDVSGCGEAIELNGELVEECFEFASIVEQPACHGRSRSRVEQRAVGQCEIASPERLWCRSGRRSAHPGRRRWRPLFGKRSDRACPARSLKTMPSREFFGERGEDRVEGSAGAGWRRSDRVGQFIAVPIGPISEAAEASPIDLQPSAFSIDRCRELSDRWMLVVVVDLDNQLTASGGEETLEHRQRRVVLFRFDPRDGRGRSAGSCRQCATRKPGSGPSFTKQSSAGSRHRGSLYAMGSDAN